MLKPAFLIPVYNHGDTLLDVISQIALYELPCLVVDDGSDTQTKALIHNVVMQFDWVTCITLPYNGGKGAAILAGFAQLLQQGYSHAIQLDADNQHQVADVAKFIDLLNAHPQSLISGMPVYDDSAPKSRLYGRKITNFWVSIETWSTQLVESMCGFRVYPLLCLVKILPKISGRRMDFDIEIIVKAYWHSIDICYIKTQVTYPAKGKSHFRLWRDNVRISWLHTRLFLSMFYYMPRLRLMRLCKTSVTAYK
ncbi:glycosyltransferase family 2 protein [Caedibacter taeniospiralis]|uniref:glycosyltransferase family 2 protein n=1 Tax=Caedibacter taeniospiralis TaxID=28907 RepID=UPI000C2718BA|nr:glycosyltransferase family 2 protein [Caedibacter taeniospiralis]